MKPLLAVLLRVHRRHEYLPTIRAQLQQLSKVVDIRLVVQTDRPTPAVCTELDRLACFPNYIEFSTATELVGRSGEQFMEALSDHYVIATGALVQPFIRKSGDLETLPDFAVLLEDDEIFPDAALDEIIALLEDWPPGLTGVRIESLFCWGDGSYNAAFPRHWRHFIFRVHPGAEFNPRGLMVHAPESLVLNGVWEDLKSPVLNYGYMDEADREATFAAYKRAGKIDAHTICLRRPPDLQPLPNLSHGDLSRQSPRTELGRPPSSGESYIKPTAP